MQQVRLEQAARLIHDTQQQVKSKELKNDGRRVWSRDIIALIYRGIPNYVVLSSMGQPVAACLLSTTLSVSRL